MLTDAQVRNLRLLFDPASCPPGYRLGGGDRESIGAALDEIDRLRAENDRLRVENDRLRAEVVRLGAGDGPGHAAV